MPRTRASAGLSSQRKYDALVRSWRRRQRKVFVTLAVICGAVLLASFVASQAWPSAGWTFGVFGGAALAFWLIARLSPPGWIENWQFGAWGEQETAKVLSKLEGEGWLILHDLSAGRGNVDHIAVGPGGVYLLDSKRLGGSVSVSPAGVTVQRIDDPELTYQHTGTGHLVSLARQTHDRVLSQTRIRTWVTPVMVIWAEFPQRVVEGRCVYVHGDELADWLRSRPQTIAPSRLRQTADAVSSAWSPQSES